MVTNCPNARVFADKFDYFSCLVEILQKSNRPDPQTRVLCFVEVDFFQKLGFIISPPGIEFIECGPDFDPNSIKYSNDIAFAIYAIQHNSIGLPIAKHLIANKIKFVPAGGHDVGGFIYDDKVAREVIEHAFITQTLLGFGKFDDPGAKEDFANLCQALLSTNHLPGDVVEVGCFHGSSGSVMLDYADKKHLTPKTFYFFDVFNGFEYPEALNSSDSIWARSHATDGIEAVTGRLKSKALGNTVQVKKVNIISDEIPSSLKNVSLCNIDVDLYEAVRAALFRMAPLIVTGGIMICEDAGHTPALIGARVALDEFMQSEYGSQFTALHMTSGQVFLVKHK